MGDVEIEKKKIISQRCSPTNEGLDKMKLFVDAVENIQLRRLLTVILCTGARVSEAMNSYVYKDDNNETTICCPVLKKSRQTKWTIKNKRECLGKQHLDALLNLDIWKERTIVNVFDLNVGWMNDELTIDLDDPNWIFDDKKITYKSMYKELKKISNMEVRYDKDKKGWRKSQRRWHNVSFHFFRKSFCSMVIREGIMNAFELTHYIIWERMDTGLDYVKGFGRLEDVKMIQKIEEERDKKFKRGGF